ncbi:alpha/beta hydrolase [Lactiplantibacillus songbeiensis]|uniref:Alpha/beta hydrolase n=1 Tax=Lactiplantibacillus songbeiensis TaxID=2559920 RepID=A0ABW4BZE6_9LACO|nr:alpha/beta fold hydrolase [Lactiplantibacillus songbeiensis]
MDFNVTRDGLTLAGIYEPAPQPNGTIAILMHGFMSDRGYTDSALLVQLAQHLREIGVGTVRFDFNGLGHSDGDFANMTVLSEIADAQAVLTAVQDRLAPQQIDLLGHSQGGVVASMLAGYYPDLIHKLVLMAPAATLKDDAIAGRTRGLVYDPHHIPAQLPMDNGRTLGGFYLRTAQLLPIYETAQNYAGPVCLIHGDADHIVSYQASQRYDKVYQNSTFHLIPGASHLLNGAARETVLQLATTFIAD